MVGETVHSLVHGHFLKARAIGISHYCRRQLDDILQAGDKLSAFSDHSIPRPARITKEPPKQ